MYGMESGTRWHAAGVTSDLGDNNPTRGANTYTFVNRFLLVAEGGGKYYFYETIHVTVNANGEVTAFVDNLSTECVE